MFNGPDTWDRLLRLLRPVVGHNAVVAGGAIRDWRLGVKPKDIDVFINPRNLDALEHQVKVLNNDYVMRDTFALTWQYPNFNSDCTRSAEEYRKWCGDVDLQAVIEGLWTTWVPHNGGESIDNEIMINLVWRPLLGSGPMTLVETFDMGCVQAYYDGNFHATPAHQVDIARRTATILREDTAHLARKRFARFNERNPGKLRLVDNYELEDVFA